MKLYFSLFAICILALLLSCTSRVYPKLYYAEHENTIGFIASRYKEITKNKALSVAFTDNHFVAIALEFKTDTVRYIYDFNYGEKRMLDSLEKFGLDTGLTKNLIDSMKSIKCTWINTLDYYLNNKKNLLVFMSVPVKQVNFLKIFRKRKYYLFNFYEQPQYYDENGRLLDKKKLRRLRKINHETFYRITDKVCYTVSSKFR
jgi:hypothetical protein